jgi:hypothetical protein
MESFVNFILHEMLLCFFVYLKTLSASDIIHNVEWLMNRLRNMLKEAVIN